MVVERIATALAGREPKPNSMQPLENVSMNLLNATVGKKVIVDQRGDIEGVDDSGANHPHPAESNWSVGNRQRAARRRARERATVQSTND